MYFNTLLSLSVIMVGINRDGGMETNTYDGNCCRMWTMFCK